MSGSSVTPPSPPSLPQLRLDGSEWPVAAGQIERWSQDLSRVLESEVGRILATFVQTALGQMQGPLLLAGDAVDPLGAVPLQQIGSAVQAAVAGSNIDAAQIVSGLINLARLGTGTPTGATVLRGDGTWGAATGSPWGLVRKPAQEFRSGSAVLTPDPHLVIPLSTPNKIYLVRGTVFTVSSAAPPGFRYDMNFTGTRFAAQEIYHRRHLAPIGAPAGTDNENVEVRAGGWLNTTTLLTQVVAGGAGSAISIQATIAVATPGDLQFRWAQNVSGPSLISVAAGSYFEWLQVD